MLKPLISGRWAQDSPVFLRGLTCAVALVRRKDSSLAPGTTGPEERYLPRAGGVGLSGPPYPHHLDLKGKLYNDLVDMLDAPPPMPLESVRGLVRMEFLQAMMSFLVRNDDDNEGETMSWGLSGVDSSHDIECDMSRRSKRKHGGPRGLERGPYYFRLGQRHACLGAVILHGLIVLAGPQPVIFSGPTLRYLCYSIQVAYLDLTMGKLSKDVGYALMFRSIQLACRALGFLATSETSDESISDGKRRGLTRENEAIIAEQGALRMVADCLLSTSAINEVACMAQMPSKGTWLGEERSVYRHLEKTVSSAALLIASICPVPAGERDPFTR